MHMKKIDVTCCQETKWRGVKTKKCEERYKLLDSRADETKHVVKIMLGQDLKDMIVNARRIIDIDLGKRVCACC